MTSPCPETLCALLRWCAQIAYLSEALVVLIPLAMNAQGSPKREAGHGHVWAQSKRATAWMRVDEREADHGHHTLNARLTMVAIP